LIISIQVIFFKAHFLEIKTWAHQIKTIVQFLSRKRYHSQISVPLIQHRLEIKNEKEEEEDT